MDETRIGQLTKQCYFRLPPMHPPTPQKEEKKVKDPSSFFFVHIAQHNKNAFLIFFFFLQPTNAAVKSASNCFMNGRHNFSWATVERPPWCQTSPLSRPFSVKPLLLYFLQTNPWPELVIFEGHFCLIIRVVLKEVFQCCVQQQQQPQKSTTGQLQQFQEHIQNSVPFNSWLTQCVFCWTLQLLPCSKVLHV